MKKVLIFLIVCSMTFQTVDFKASMSIGKGLLWRDNSIYMKLPRNGASNMSSRVTKNHDTGYRYACTSIHLYGYKDEPAGKLLDRYCENLLYNNSYIRVTSWNLGGYREFTALGTRNSSQAQGFKVVVNGS